MIISKIMMLKNHPTKMMKIYWKRKLMLKLINRKMKKKVSISSLKKILITRRNLIKRNLNKRKLIRRNYNKRNYIKKNLIKKSLIVK